MQAINGDALLNHVIPRPLSLQQLGILWINHHQRRHAALFHNLRIDNHCCEDLCRLRGAKVVAGYVMASRSLEEGAARGNHVRRSVVHLVDHGALCDEDGDAGAGMGVRRRRRVWREVDQETD